MTVSPENPFPTVMSLARACSETWNSYEIAAKRTLDAEAELREALLRTGPLERLLSADCAIVLSGSFARYEMVGGSDYDWEILIDGVVSADHGMLARKVETALKHAGLQAPAAAGTFGKLVFSHELVHCIGGGADSNENMTRRMLMLLESRSLNLTEGDDDRIVWGNVISNILKRYFEVDVHFVPDSGEGRVPRFLLNDLTRYWRTICVDYAAKYREQDGKKWALRNAKLRFSRKLLYAAGLAFCLSCQLKPPRKIHEDLFGIHLDNSAEPYRDMAFNFAQTPPLEYLAAFVEEFVEDPERQKRIAKKIFGSYDKWLAMLNDNVVRSSLEILQHEEAEANEYFQEIRVIGSAFASGLREVFFSRDTDADPVANLSLDYVGF